MVGVMVLAVCGMASALSTREFVMRPIVGRRAALASAGAGLAAVLAPPAGAIVYLDPARYGDQELKNAAIAKCRTRVRDAVVKQPSMAPSFFLLAVLDGLSYNEKTRKGGPDGTVAASIQLPGAKYEALREALDVLQESQQALKRTNALTLADLVALAGAEAVAAVGGPEISVQLGRTDSEKLGENMRAVAKGGEKAAVERGILPAFDLENIDPAAVLAAFSRSGFTVREAAVLLGTLAALQQESVVAAPAEEKEERGTFAKRGKMGRATEKKSSNVAIDLYGTNEGEEDADVDKFEGDLDEFYIADAFGSRKQAYGRRVGSTKGVDTEFNQIFNTYTFAARDRKPATGWVEQTLRSDNNALIWIAKYGTERLTYIKDIGKTFYRVTEVGGVYTGGKYAALLDNRGPQKLE